MAEYVERETLLSKLSRMIDYCKKDQKVTGLTALFQVGDAIMDCPSADVAPVVHGRWIEREDPMLDVYYVCSVCKEAFYIEATGYTEDDMFLYTYCPNCGAKIDEKEENKE